MKRRIRRRQKKQFVKSKTREMVEGRKSKKKKGGGNKMGRKKINRKKSTTPMKIDEEKDGEEKKQNKNIRIKIITLEVRRRKKQGQDE